MTIKVDMEKAYDRFNWNFLTDTLKDIGISDMMNGIVMRYVFMCRMRIIWNEISTKEFSFFRGIYQGDPLSPYPFVLVIERLTHIIEYSIIVNKRRSIKLSRKGPNLSHLIFDDDLILFAEVDLKQFRIIQTCLDIFCKASGEKVNKEKNTPILLTESPPKCGFRVESRDEFCFSVGSWQVHGHSPTS